MIKYSNRRMERKILNYWLMGLLAVSVALLVGATNNPFIYTRF